MRYSDEQIQRAADTSIVEYFRSHGYDCETKGRDVHIKGFGGLYITDDKKYYCFSKQQGGYGLISCLRDTFDMTFLDAVKEILGEEPDAVVENKKENEREKIFVSEPQAQVKKEFVQPERAENEKRVYAYLTKQRGIAPDIIKSLIDKGLLYQDTKGNAVFIHKDNNGKAIGAALQGTTSDVRFKGMASGSSGALRYDKGKVKAAYVFEAPIDMMSYMQLHPELDNCCFVAMSGLKHSVVHSLSEQGFKIISCVDNDKAGKEFNYRLYEQNIGLQSILHKQKIDFQMTKADISKKDGTALSISFAQSEINDVKSFFFKNAEDCKYVKNLDELDGRTFVAIHSDEYFKVDEECVRENVKDFNELLCKKNESQNLSSLIKRAAVNKDDTVQSNDDLTVKRSSIIK